MEKEKEPEKKQESEEPQQVSESPNDINHDVKQELNYPNFQAFLVPLEGEYSKRLGQKIYTFNKYIVLLPSGWDSSHHFGQDKEFFWEDIPISLTQGVAGYVFLKGKMFLGEWIPMFVLWYSSWWVDWVQRNFDTNNTKSVNDILIKLQTFLKKDAPDIGYTSYFMKLALTLKEENIDLDNHLKGELDNDRNNNELVIRRANGILTRHGNIMQVPSERKIDWKTIGGLIFLGGATIITYAWWQGWIF